MELVFVSHNPHKIEEISEILGQGFSLKGLGDLPCHEDIPEPHETLEDNALEKARYVNRKFGVDCFADDTGLEVEALDGLPGVHSARYAGEAKDSEANIEKLLKNLEGEENRKARFRTVIALILNGREYLFEGVVNGTIARQKAGTKGFGYDPVFVPNGYQTTFAQMPLHEKNRISHRGRAIQKLAAFLKSLPGT